MMAQAEADAAQLSAQILEQARQDNAEAMFSGHDIPAEKAAAMQHFVQETLQACRAERNLFQRFADRWVHIWY